MKRQEFRNRIPWLSNPNSHNCPFFGGKNCNKISSCDWAIFFFFPSAKIRTVQKRRYIGGHRAPKVHTTPLERETRSAGSSDRGREYNKALQCARRSSTSARVNEVWSQVSSVNETHQLALPIGRFTSSHALPTHRANHNKCTPEYMLCEDR